MTITLGPWQIAALIVLILIAIVILRLAATLIGTVLLRRLSARTLNETNQLQGQLSSIGCGVSGRDARFLRDILPNATRFDHEGAEVPGVDLRDFKFERPKDWASAVDINTEWPSVPDVPEQPGLREGYEPVQGWCLDPQHVSELFTTYQQTMDKALEALEKDRTRLRVYAGQAQTPSHAWPEDDLVELETWRNDDGTLQCAYGTLYEDEQGRKLEPLGSTGIQPGGVSYDPGDLLIAPREKPARKGRRGKHRKGRWHW